MACIIKHFTFTINSQRSKLASSLMSVTLTSLDKHTTLLSAVKTLSKRAAL
jgi:hypothetical protein